MYRKSYVRKTKKEAKLPFEIHSVSEVCVYPSWWGKWNETIRVVSIDPGITHFCVRIEERTGDIFKTLKLIKTNLGDRSTLVKKTVSNDTKLKSLIKTDECKADVFEGGDKYKKAFEEPVRVYGRLVKLLDSMKDELMRSDLVIVEGQLRVNYKMTRFGQHILSYFTNLQVASNSHFLLVEVDPKLKSRLADQKPKDVKKWSVEYARNIATKCGDEEGLKLLNKRGKTNDFADTLVQIEGFFNYVKN